MQVNMGRVHIINEGVHDSTRAYNRLSQVKSLSGDFYVCYAPVPTGIQLTDSTHWQLTIDNSGEQTVKKYVGGAGTVVAPSLLSDGSTPIVQIF